MALYCVAKPCSSATTYQTSETHLPKYLFFFNALKSFYSFLSRSVFQLMYQNTSKRKFLLGTDVINCSHVFSLAFTLFRLLYIFPSAAGLQATYIITNMLKTCGELNSPFTHADRVILQGRIFSILHLVSPW
jgi:hypothetical protein